MNQHPRFPALGSSPEAAAITLTPKEVKDLRNVLDGIQHYAVKLQDILKLTCFVLIFFAVSGSARAQSVALSQAYPESFMGITYGKPITASVPKCDTNSTTTDVLCYDGTGGGASAPIVGVFRPGEGSGEIIAEQDQSGVYMTSLAIKTSDVDAYQKALTSRFGPPTEEHHTPVENEYGATFIIDTWYYLTDRFSIQLKGPDTLGGRTGSIVVLTRAFYDAQVAKRQSDQKKIGSDFNTGVK